MVRESRINRFTLADGTLSSICVRIQIEMVSHVDGQLFFGKRVEAIPFDDDATTDDSYIDEDEQPNGEVKTQSPFF